MIVIGWLPRSIVGHVSAGVCLKFLDLDLNYSCQSPDVHCGNGVYTPAGTIQQASGF